MSKRFLKTNKKLLGVLCLASMMTLTSTPAQAATNIYANVRINNVVPVFNAQPYMTNGSTYLPLRSVGTYLGANTSWDAATRTVTITNGTTTIQCKANATSVLVNGVTKQIGNPVVIKNGITYVPIRFISETLGIGVKYTAAGNWVDLSIPSKTQLDIMAISDVEREKIYKDTLNSNLTLQPVSKYGTLFTGTFAYKPVNKEALKELYVLKSSQLPIDIGDAIIYNLSVDYTKNVITVKYKPKDNKEHSLDIYLAVPNEGMKRTRQQSSVKENADGTVTYTFINSSNVDFLRFPKEDVNAFKLSKVSYFCIKGKSNLYAIEVK